MSGFGSAWPLNANLVKETKQAKTANVLKQHLLVVAKKWSLTGSWPPRIQGVRRKVKDLPMGGDVPASQNFIQPAPRAATDCGRQLTDVEELRVRNFQ
jgi:hypothetical protein